LARGAPDFVGVLVVNDGLQISEKGQALVKSFENCLTAVNAAKTEFKPYYCPAHVLTIGWGHTNDNGRKFKEGDIWTKGECDAEFRADMRKFETAVRRRVKVALTQSQFDALVSFTYNCGEGNLARSGLLRKVNAKDFDGAADEFAKWNRGGGQVLRGLTRRRAAEAALFREGNHEDVRASYRAECRKDPEPEPMPQGVDAPDGTARPMSTSKIGNTQIAIGAAGAAEAASKVSDALDQAKTVKQGAEDLGMGDVLTHLLTMPTFWIAVAIVVAAGAAWYWRSQHAAEGT
jgi:lysozyme